MKKIIFLLLGLLPTIAFSQTDTAVVKFINPSTVPASKGYSQAVQIDMGTSKMLIISGQIALDKAGNLVGKEDFAKQAEQAFTNIRNIVTEAGGTMDNVVKLNYYLLDVKQVQTLRAIRDRFINIKHPPVSTLVQISKLFRDDLLLEVEATAVIPKK